MWKEIVVAYFKALSKSLPWIQDIKKILSL